MPKTPLPLKPIAALNRRRRDARGADRLERLVVERTQHLQPAPVEPVEQEKPASDWRRLRSWTFRHRKDIVAPAAVAAVLTADRWLIHTYLGWAWLTLAPIAVAAAWWVRQVKDGKPAWAARAAAISGFLWVALPVASLPEIPTWTGGPLLLAVMVVRHLRFRARGVPAPTVPELSNADRFNDVLVPKAKDLADYFAADEQEVIDPRSGEVVGFDLAITAPEGSEGAPAVSGVRNKIATTYRCDVASIEIPPTTDLARFHLRVVRSGTLAESRPWLPADVAPGAESVEVTTFGDGTRGCLLIYKRGQGVRHFWFAGGSGGGKSGGVSCALGRIMQTGYVILHLTDLGETSLPAWMPVAFRSGVTVEDGLMAMRRANALIDARRAAMRTMTRIDRDGTEIVGISTLDPTPEWPEHLFVFEEWPEMLGCAEAVELADRIGRLGRKYGVAIWIVSQGVTLKEAFGEAGVLRTNIQRNGNVAVFSSDKESGQYAIGGTIKIDPSSIPLGRPGLSFLITPVQQRDAMSRFDWISDEEDRPEGVLSSWQVAKLARPATPNPLDLEAIRRVEEQYAEKVVNELKKVGAVAMTRALVEEVVTDVAGTAGDGIARNAAIYDEVAKRTGVALADEAAMAKLAERVRWHLKASPAIESAGWGQWTVLQAVAS